MSVDFATARTIMVDSQVRTQDVTNLAIQDAMRSAPRETLVPAGRGYLAYADAEVEGVGGCWLLRPRFVAKLLQAADPRRGERALALAAPYAALVLEHMGLAVTRVEQAPLVAPEGPWDVIICEGAVARAPAAWTEALAVGGRLLVCERDGVIGRATLYLRSGDDIGRRFLFDCAPPFLEGLAPEPSFVF